MKNLIPLAFALACVGANAKDIRTCQDAGVGIDNLILPASENSRTFYNNRVAVFAIDMIEPAAGSMGIAITLRMLQIFLLAARNALRSRILLRLT